MPVYTLAVALALALHGPARDTLPVVDTLAQIARVEHVRGNGPAAAILNAWSATPRRYCVDAWHVDGSVFAIDAMSEATDGPAPCAGLPVFVQIPRPVACGAMADAVLGLERPAFFLAQYMPSQFRFCVRQRAAVREA